ncbi:MAG TPA: UDP-N-acetylmuramate dehydrogenase [Terriglobales bacterium]
MNIQENVPLAPYTTFKVGGPARYFVEAYSEKEVQQALEFSVSRRLRLFVLGGGSNLVVSDQGWPGLVIKISIPGIRSETTNGKMVFHAGAGEDWDGFVAKTVVAGCAGIECLSGIPGTTGGTPVQNVGAYGQEVAETITRVRVLALATGKIFEMSNAECGFSYRTSIFNSTERDRYIVLGTTFALTPGGRPHIEYADLKRHFAGTSSPPTLAAARDAVRAIRHSKAMLITSDDEDCRSAGSFFKNPILTSDEYEALNKIIRSMNKQIPTYPAGEGKVKVAAAWLVENAGFYKGYSRGPVGISRKHSLAIVNRGGAKATDIVALKNEVQQGVKQKFGVELHPEPVFVGF